MIKYICDIKDCGLEGTQYSGKDWCDQEYFDVHVEGADYMWARIGIANKTLCPEHRRQAMQNLIGSIVSKYPPKPPLPSK